MYITTAIIMPFLISIFLQTKIFRTILFKTNRKSINDAIFNDIIDYDKKTIMRIYLKSSPVMYIGTFKIREEKGTESYITLIDYVSFNIENGKNIIFQPDKYKLKSSVVINLKDIERIELIYEKNSQLIERLGLLNTKKEDKNIKVKDAPEPMDILMQIKAQEKCNNIEQEN